MIKKLLAVILLFIGLSTVSVYAVNAGRTTTLIWFNIGVVENVQVQMLSSGTWTSVSSTGAATTNDIDINSTGNEMTWNNASIRGSSNIQAATTPIIKIANNGNTNASINISLNATALPGGATSCTIRFRYYNSSNTGTWTSPTAPDLANSTWNGNVTLTPALQTQQQLYLWLFANYTLCSSSDSTARNFTIYADYVA